jgi:hypothetical protein
MNYKVITDSFKNRKSIRKKSLFTAVAVGLGLTASMMAQVPSYVPTNGLVGWWPFNGNANDESGNGNNGTVNGATLTTDRFGNAGNAYNFDGINDWIEISDNSSLDLNFELTLSAWINTNSISVTQRIIDKSTVGQADSWCFDLGVMGVGDLRLIVAGSVINQAMSQANIIENNIWTHVLTTYNGTSVKFYVNGIMVYSISQIGSTPSNNNSVRIGVNSLYNNEWFDGDLDDIGIWNRALSECEIQDLYNAQINSVAGSIAVSPQPASTGSNVSLTTASNSTNVQWQNNPLNNGWQNVPSNSTYSGGTTNTLTVNNVQLSNHNQPFRVIASNGNCIDTSNIATIQIADTCITNVTVYDTLLTTVTDTLIINTTLSLPAPNNENTILIYPNPASDHITIDNGNFAAMAGYSIKIENNAGQQVFQSLINQAQFYVDLSTWTGNGLYFVHLIDPQNNTVSVRKIVLQ